MWTVLTLAACSSPLEPDAPRAQPTEEAIALFRYDASLPLELQILGVDTVEGVEVHDISYESPKGGRVPGYLFIPPGEGPFAGMSIMHGLPGHRDQLIGHAPRFPHTGAVVVVISAPHGRPDVSPRDFAVTFTPRDSVEHVQYIVDERRAIDILLARPDVDPARLGVVGGSYSGGMAGLLSGVEGNARTSVRNAATGSTRTTRRAAPGARASRHIEHWASPRLSERRRSAQPPRVWSCLCCPRVPGGPEL